MYEKRQRLDAIAEAHRNGWITVGCIPAPINRDRDGYGRLDLEQNGERLRYSAHNYTSGKLRVTAPEALAAHRCRMKGCANPLVSWSNGVRTRQTATGTARPRSVPEPQYQAHRVTGTGYPQGLRLRRAATRLAERYGWALISDIVTGQLRRAEDDGLTVGGHGAERLRDSVGSSRGPAGLPGTS